MMMIQTLESRTLFTATAATANDPSLAGQWGLSAVAAQAAWDTTTGSAAVVVADIDTGAQYTHDDLWENVWINQAEIPRKVRRVLTDVDGDGVLSFYDLNAAANFSKLTDVDGNGRIDAADLLTKGRYGGWADGADEGDNGYVDDIIGWDFAENDNNPTDYDGHGTHTAGTIAAMGDDGTGVSGVEWKSSLMLVKIFDDQGNSASASQIAAAIRYSADDGAVVSNNSWGGGGYSTAIYNAIAYAGTKGQLFVVAAGNDAANLDSAYYNDYPSEYALSNILVVGATTSTGARASYSNYGASQVDVFAPGSSVLSTYLGDTYETMSGTSMATPQVTGAAALMLSADGSLTAAELKARIVAGADQSAALAGRSVAGGELNIANAIADATGTRYAGAASGTTTTPIVPGRRTFSVPPVSGGATSATAAPSYVAAPQLVQASRPSEAATAVSVLADTSSAAVTAAPADRAAGLASTTAMATGAIFSTRRVSTASADRVGTPFPRIAMAMAATGSGDSGARPGAPVADLTPSTPPTIAYADLALGWAAGAAPRDLATANEADAATPATELPLLTPAAVANADVAAALGRRIAWLVGGIAALASGGYALRRRSRSAADAAGATGDAEPVEFPLHHS